MAPYPRTNSRNNENMIHVWVPEVNLHANYPPACRQSTKMKIRGQITAGKLLLRY